MSTSSSRSHAPTTPVRAPLPRSPPRLQYLAPTSGVGSALIPHTLALAALLPTGAPRRRPHTRTAAPWAISVCRPAAPASTTRSAAVVAAFLHRRPTFFIQIIVFTGRPAVLRPRCLPVDEVSFQGFSLRSVHVRVFRPLKPLFTGFEPEAPVFSTGTPGTFVFI
ncbi:hypothetical protein U9M48_002305 [Paspalum notatum var. saurae]|uniref:Uncharacterized protein n=1 Tax=Paspalum notatum var. saurae TaxID=547442 RepID=A0AAQ3PFV8_PASNO